MCNFYIMYYKDPKTKIPYPQCVGNNLDGVADKMPADSLVQLPRNASLEAAAHGNNHMGGHKGAPDKQADEPIPPQGKLSSSLSNRYRNPRRQNVYPRDYSPDYGLNDYYNDIESRRNRKNYRQPVYDYYNSEDSHRYPYDQRRGNLNTGSDYQTKSRNRNKAFDSASKHADGVNNQQDFHRSRFNVNQPRNGLSHNVGHKKGRIAQVEPIRSTTTVGAPGGSSNILGGHNPGLILVAWPVVKCCI